MEKELGEEKWSEITGERAGYSHFRNDSATRTTTEPFRTHCKAFTLLGSEKYWRVRERNGKYRTMTILYFYNIDIRMTLL